MDPRAFALASSIANALASQDPRTQSDALTHLAQIVDTAYGDDAIYLCDFIRLNGLVQLLGDMIASPDPTLHQPALLVFGNIASEAVDPNAGITKAIFKDGGGFEKARSTAPRQ